MFDFFNRAVGVPFHRYELNFTINLHSRVDNFHERNAVVIFVAARHGYYLFVFAELEK